MAFHGFTTLLRQLRRLVGTEPDAALDDGQLLQSFVRQRDEAAFATIVERYGPLVRSLCCRWLRDPHAADDAFQATFLVLAKRAASIRQERSLGSWLYGVTYRVALEARAAAARRRARERQASDMSPSDIDLPDLRPGDPLSNTAQHEARELLDLELHRLPEKLRAPLVLCYLEGKTNEQAAQQLGCPTSSLSRRLGRGRELLRERLSRRGVTLPATALTALLVGGISRAAVPGKLATLTAQAALLFLAGHKEAPGVLSLEATQLTKGVLNTMAMTKLRTFIAAALLFGILGAGAGVLLRGTAAEAPPNSAGDARPGQTAPFTDVQRDEAIHKGLKWLAARQLDDGHWSVIGNDYDVAGTAFGLLPLLRAGHTHKDAGSPYAKHVDKGLNFLLARQGNNGLMSDAPSRYMYGHALATMALCEAYGRSNDAKLKDRAQKAIDFIVAAQTDKGAWGYVTAKDGGNYGDTSVTGWQVQALSLGERAGLKVPKDTWTKAAGYLDSAMTGDGLYRYSPLAGPGTPTLTAVGLFCRQLGAGKSNPKSSARGLDYLRSFPPGKFVAGHTMYYYYYATQALNHIGMNAEAWNREMRSFLIKTQADDGTFASERGYLGPLYTTSLSLLTLEAEDTFLLPPPLPERDLKDAEVGALWKELGDGNAFQSVEALRKLAAGPRQVVPFLQKQLKPVAPPDEQLIARRIDDLNSTQFPVRQKAEEELEKLGELAVPALQRVLKEKPTLEVRQRVDRLLTKAQEAPLTTERVQALRGIRVLECIGNPEARKVLETLAGGATGALPTREAAQALRRIDQRKEAKLKKDR